MRDRGVLNMRRAFPRMSWSPKNLYNLYRRTAGPRADDLRFRLTASTTLFQQRWKSKALVRAYHGDFIPEKIFKRWYLPETLPDVRPARVAAAPAGDDKALLDDYARRKNRETQFNEEIEEKGMAPVGSLMFAEVERRIDVFIFRCCFAHSVYEARRLVIHGDVYLNGKKHTNANTRLAPGDMVSVNPDAIRFFKNLPGEHDDIVARLLEPSKKSTKAAPVETEAVEAIEVETVSATEPQATSSEETPAPSEESSPEETPSETSLPAPRYTPFKLPHYASPHLFIPSYIEPSFSTCSAIYVRHPTARPGYSEIPTPYDADGALIRYAWEWYVQRRPRVRSQAQLARMPEDRALGATKEERDQRKKAIVEEGRKRRVVDTDRIRKVLKNSGRKVKAV